ncbi:hypothetical protein B296_00042051 [Ensete ventricosum]|uniref:Uncharacterized protein n=1 Tax=Ensete ventricosum TaxID=4639 RepID=A0A426YYE7_ENSVE|nr:hypothetical protein B296_00042051 [Ensete ventricosum]
MPVLSLEELDLLTIVDSGAEVINRDDFGQRDSLLEEVMEIYRCHGIRLQIYNTDGRGRLKERLVAAAERVTVRWTTTVNGYVAAGDDVRVGNQKWLVEEEDGNDDDNSSRSDNNRGRSSWVHGCMWQMRRSDAGVATAAVGGVDSKGGGNNATMHE